MEFWGCLAERDVRGLSGHSLSCKGPIDFRGFDPDPHFPSALEEWPWPPGLSHLLGGRIPTNILDSKDSPFPSAQAYAKQAVWEMSQIFHGRFVSQ